MSAETTEAAPAVPKEYCRQFCSGGYCKRKNAPYGCPYTHDEALRKEAMKMKRAAAKTKKAEATTTQTSSSQPSQEPTSSSASHSLAKSTASGSTIENQPLKKKNAAAKVKTAEVLQSSASGSSQQQATSSPSQPPAEAITAISNTDRQSRKNRNAAAKVENPEAAQSIPPQGTEPSQEPSSPITLQSPAKDTPIASTADKKPSKKRNNARKSKKVSVAESVPKQADEPSGEQESSSASQLPAEVTPAISATQKQSLEDENSATEVNEAEAAQSSQVQAAATDLDQPLLSALQPSVEDRVVPIINNASSKGNSEHQASNSHKMAKFRSPKFRSASQSFQAHYKVHGPLERHKLGHEVKVFLEEVAWDLWCNDNKPGPEWIVLARLIKEKEERELAALSTPSVGSSEASSEYGMSTAPSSPSTSVADESPRALAKFGKSKSSVKAKVKLGPVAPRAAVKFVKFGGPIAGPVAKPRAPEVASVASTYAATAAIGLPTPKVKLPSTAQPPAPNKPWDWVEGSDKKQSLDPNDLKAWAERNLELTTANAFLKPYLEKQKVPAKVLFKLAMAKFGVNWDPNGQTFILFPDFPYEIRALIFKFAMKMGQMQYRLRWKENKNGGLTFRAQGTACPPLMHTCQLSRLLAQKFYQLVFATKTATAASFFNFENDSVFFHDYRNDIADYILKPDLMNLKYITCAMRDCMVGPRQFVEGISKFKGLHTLTLIIADTKEDAEYVQKTPEWADECFKKLTAVWHQKYNRVIHIDEETEKKTRQLMTRYWPSLAYQVIDGLVGKQVYQIDGIGSCYERGWDGVVRMIPRGTYDEFPGSSR